MITKQIKDNQLYVYFNGTLIYKRWLWLNNGRMFYENEGLTQWTRKV